MCVLANRYANKQNCEQQKRERERENAFASTAFNVSASSAQRTQKMRSQKQKKMKTATVYEECELIKPMIERCANATGLKPKKKKTATEVENKKTACVIAMSTTGYCFID